jgi:hypothetical protein
MKFLQSTIDEICRLAKQKDGWFGPTTDLANNKKARRDYGYWLQREQEGWEQTTHFEIAYRQVIAELMDEEAERLKIVETYGERNDKWLILLEEAMSLFWETWGNRPYIYKFWKNYIQRKQKFLFETI